MRSFLAMIIVVIHMQVLDEDLKSHKKDIELLEEQKGKITAVSSNELFVKPNAQHANTYECMRMKCAKKLCTDFMSQGFCSEELCSIDVRLDSLFV